MLIKDIAEYLQAKGIGFPGTDVFLGTMPDTPESVIVLYPTGGYPQVLPLEDIQVTVQIMVRDLDYTTGYKRIQAVFNALDGGENRYIRVLSGRQMVCRAMQSPFFLEQDAKGRFVFAFNVVVWTTRD